MNTIYDSKIYEEELKYVSSDPIFKELEGKSLFITGGTGCVLSYLVDAILSTNIKCLIFLAVRDFRSALSRFSKHVGDPRLHFIQKELKDLDTLDKLEMDYVIAGASRTNLSDIENRPVDVFLDNINGLRGAASICKNYAKSKLLVLSTIKVYGLNSDALKEDDLSFFNSRTSTDILGFSKLASEKLALSFSSQDQLNVSIARLSRTFGPTVKVDDSKEINEFFFETLNNDDIFLKTEGCEVIPFHYVGDTARAILYVLIRGERDKAYNVGAEESFKLKDIAKTISSFGKKEVVYSDSVKQSPRTSKNLVSIDELKSLGFENKFSIKQSLKTTYDILKDIY